MGIARFGHDSSAGLLAEACCDGPWSSYLPAAQRKLKWKEINCTIFDGMAADEAELAEIDENLIRAELSPAERALHIGKRKELYEKVHPETKKGGAPGKAGGGKKSKTAKLATFARNTRDRGR
jgi:ParB family chromosome partitioning protein